MSIQAIPAISAIAPPSAVMGITGTNGPAAGASATAGADFAGQLGAGLENLQALQTKSDNLAIQAATGQLTDVHDYIIASTEANLATQLTVAVRNKALDAFNEIMRMQA